MTKRVGLDVIYMPPNEGFSKIVAMREYLSGWVEFLWNLVEVFYSQRVCKILEGGRDVKQVPVFADLMCAKYLGCYHVIFRCSVSLFRKVSLCRKVVLCRKYILFG